MTQDLLIGAKAYKHPAWLNSFYPADLPDEWRLGFYANEFQTILLPEADWIGADEEQIYQWFDEVQDEFIFYFELSQASLVQTNTSPSFKAALSLLNDAPEHVGGLVIAGTCADISHKVDQFREKNAVNLSITCDALAISSGSQHGKNIMSNIGILDTTAALSQPELRRQLEQFISLVEQNAPCALFLSGDPPNISNLRDIKMLKELIMG